MHNITGTLWISCGQLWRHDAPEPLCPNAIPPYRQRRRAHCSLSMVLGLTLLEEGLVV